ncbi:FAD:protein FMN transferase [Pseudoflavonifractor sp. 60]|uniref:FAD:protein FMN transferase n=1 Tax=Pseudoflavonifractor sp. 60 TaxID=2304576 RepID=UPI0013706700|nr:FAD:protein FMN transferase [Pseudoflavonifractor sp. 60]MCI8913696.1 FAD:protein FMN transferase [Lawsonibacter sp.]NBI66592.1 FAD:protein FMN transferase [Pseudoflavonifractor sp. 60]
MRKKVICVITAVLILLSCAGCGKQEEAADRSFFALDTYITMQAVGPDAEQALETAEESIRELERKWSVTSPGSEIYTVNQSGGNPTSISEDTAEILRFVLDMAQDTDGALDPTIYPVLTAWGFTTDSYQVPSQEELDTLLSYVDYQSIQLTGGTVTVPVECQIDLGSVAKGYIGDLVADSLRKCGITSALINLGGNVQAVGAKADGSPWRIGVRDPMANGNLGVLEITDQAVVTSGGYERYFTDADGNVYWHILDPQTGYPARNGLISVTVVSPEGKRSDALSTALFVMGMERAIEYWCAHGNFEMLLVTENGTVLLTGGLENAFTLDEEQNGREVTVIHHEAE